MKILKNKIMKTITTINPATEEEIKTYNRISEKTTQEKVAIKIYDKKKLIDW